MPINLPTTKLFIFINRLFINNRDFSSQLGYKIIIINEFTRENNFIIYSKHYKEKLLITTSTFNLYFLIITIGTPFRIVGI